MKLIIIMNNNIYNNNDDYHDASDNDNRDYDEDNAFKRTSFIQGLRIIWKVSIYQNQCWLIINWSLCDKLLWNSNPNTRIVIHENFENKVTSLRNGVPYHTVP